jgi:membrane glycosyltransferase
MEFNSKHKNDIPEGYFDQLEQRLQKIPSEHPQSAPRVIRLLRKSWVAAAAVAVLIGFNYWMNSSSKTEEMALTEEEYYELLIATTEDYELLYYGLIDIETTENNDYIDMYADEYTDYDIIGLE